MKVQQKHSSHYTGCQSEQELTTNCCVLFITVNMEKHGKAPQYLKDC